MLYDYQCLHLLDESLHSWLPLTLYGSFAHYLSPCHQHTSFPRVGLCQCRLAYGKGSNICRLNDERSVPALWCFLSPPLQEAVCLPPSLA